jgi:hypothetical protein
MSNGGPSQGTPHRSPRGEGKPVGTGPGLAGRKGAAVRRAGALALAAWMRSAAVLLSFAWAGSAMLLAAAHAQGMRDPTLPPAGAVGAPVSDASGRPAAPDTGPVAVIVRDGQPYLVVGTRLYAQGQMLGGARVERITETEVWLREGKTLHKKPIFSGISRTVAGVTPSLPECVVPTGKAPAPRRPTPAPAAGKKAALPPPGEHCKP